MQRAADPPSEKSTLFVGFGLQFCGEIEGNRNRPTRPRLAWPACSTHPRIGRGYSIHSVCPAIQTRLARGRVSRAPPQIDRPTMGPVLAPTPGFHPSLLTTLENGAADPVALTSSDACCAPLTLAAAPVRERLWFRLDGHGAPAALAFA